mmetsp:Transcript_12159/g.16248  ORF Transcript_12159/g.16248 Transcript_12159/m.16248 type:complete len:81 (-) Transcript_12159:36-278(-)
MTAPATNAAGAPKLAVQSQASAAKEVLSYSKPLSSMPFMEEWRCVTECLGGMIMDGPGNTGNWFPLAWFVIRLWRGAKAS